MQQTIRVSDIKVGKRCRSDLGDIAGLSKSIRELGLLQPIAVTPEHALVAGFRRLEAVRELGWDEVPVHVVSGLNDALALLKAERDENTCRKDFSPLELVAMGKRMEELLKPKAKEREREGGKKGGQMAGRSRPKQEQKGSGKLPDPCPSPANGQTRDQVAEALGTSGRTYQKAKVRADLPEPSRDHRAEEASVEPTFTDYDGDDVGALALVISLNVQRRDLTAAQRAIVAARALPMFEEAGLKRKLTGKSADGEAGGRGKTKPPALSGQEVLSREAVAQVFKVGKNAVQQAKALLTEAADLIAQMEACALSLASAYDQLQQRREQAKRKGKRKAWVSKRLIFGRFLKTYPNGIQTGLTERRFREHWKRTKGKEADRLPRFSASVKTC